MPATRRLASRGRQFASHAISIASRRSRPDSSASPSPPPTTAASRASMNWRSGRPGDELDQRRAGVGRRARRPPPAPSRALPIHKLEHLNDGQYGNSHSWISNQAGRGWVQIELPPEDARSTASSGAAIASSDSSIGCRLVTGSKWRRSRMRGSVVASSEDRAASPVAINAPVPANLAAQNRSDGAASSCEQRGRA